MCAHRDIAVAGGGRQRHDGVSLRGRESVRGHLQVVRVRAVEESVDATNHALGDGGNFLWVGC